MEIIRKIILQEENRDRFTKEHIEYMVDSAKAFNGMENPRYKLVRSAADDEGTNAIILIDKKNKKVVDWGNARVPARVTDIVNKFKQMSGRKF